jgi:DNA-directed RNA polymerase specialized sigma24 family protein
VPGADRHEAAHLGLVAIWQAVPRIDPARAATARAFLLAHAGYAIRKYVRVERMHLAALADTTLEMESGPNGADVEAATVRTVLEALAGVDPLAHAVVERHLLEGVPIVHVGPPLGLTHSQARTRYERGIAWMKRRVG